MKPVTLTTTKWIHAGSLPPPIGPHRGLGTELLPNILTHTSHYNPSTGTSTTSQVHTGADSNQSVTGVPSIGSIRNTSFPVVVPMSYSLLPSSFMQREREIFCQSDSEDEAIEYIHPKKSKLSQDSIKTDIWKDNMNSKYCVSL